MPRGPAVPIKGVWLRRLGDYLIVSVEAEDGRDIEIIRDFCDSNYSHSVSEYGLAAAISAAPTSIGRPN